MEKKLTTAFQVSNMPEEAFVHSFSSAFGDPEVAVSVHRHSVRSRIRNERFLVSALQTIRGSGLKVIDGGASKAGMEKRIETFNDASRKTKTQVNLEKLFGSLDYCECSDCTSVYSPASYFVELLEFLRHNNLQPGNSHIGDMTSFKGTQLEQLLIRRPDLACIQLTCENTNTLIPYIDLALEVMESYVVHAPTITAYNVNGETSSELLCQPQHTDLTAYETLRDSVYPFQLPYNFAIDTMRVFLGFLKTTRADMIKIFQPTAVQVIPNPTPAQEATQRAFDAEFNLISQEEYVILTKESFLRRQSHGHEDCCDCQRCSSNSRQYAQKIHLREPWEYYGYKTETEMQNKAHSGLTWVKAQFLKRTGIQYTDLVELLKTRWVNPNMPQGKALKTLEQIRFSYRFLSFLVQTKFKDKNRRFRRLISFLCLAQPLIPLIEWAKEKDDPCSGISGGLCACDQVPSQCSCICESEDEWTCWTYDWFEKIGKITVLESGEGPVLPIRGRVWAEPRGESEALELTSASEPSQPVETGPEARSTSKLIGTLHADGSIITDAGEVVAFVTVDSIVIDVDTGKPLTDAWDSFNIYIVAQDGGTNIQRKLLGYINAGKRLNGVLMLYNLNGDGSQRARYSPAQDTCDIEKVRLLHLDGSSVLPEEYDRMQRFLRLWQKMGWTISETDSAIAGLGEPKISEQSSNESGQADTPSGSEDEPEDSNALSRPTAQSTDISPDFIHQLVAVKKLLDVTGFELSVLLTFWTTISQTGDGSLYSTTFLTHNLLRMDDVFKADTNGNYLSGSEKMTSHMTILQAALRLTADDISLMLSKPDTFKIKDQLDLQNVSVLYRWSQLSKFLLVRINQLEDVTVIFGDPFTNAVTTLTFLETWAKMNDSGFTFFQLNYLISGHDNVSHPFAPGLPQILGLTKTLFDGLVAIDKQQPDISQDDVDNKVVSLVDVLPAKLVLIFTPDLATKIAQFINGQYQFITNAAVGLTFDGSFPSKVKYVEQKQATPPAAQLVVTGILSDEEANNTKALSNHPLWAPAVDRVRKQAVTFYNQNLSSILPSDGTTTMLKADTADTASEKAMYYLNSFMPLVRATLARQMIQSTISDAIGLNPILTSYLLLNVHSSDNSSAMDDLLELKTIGFPKSLGWSGYLIAPSTDTFVFTVTTDTEPEAMVIDGVAIPFPNQSEDPSNLWSSASFKMVAGTLYHVTLTGIAPGQLQWRTATSASTTIPDSALLPALSSDKVTTCLTKLFKLSILIQGFSFSLDEVVYFHDHPKDFASEDDGKELALDSLKIGTWKRLQAYASLRDKLPKQKFRLIDLFKWATLDTSKGQDPAPAIVQLSPLWDPKKLKAILSGWNLLDVANFKNEIVLSKMQDATEFVKMVGIDIQKLFEWSKPLSLSLNSYRKLVSQSTALKDELRSRYLASDWEQAVKPLFDSLRRNQRDALVAYLIVDESLVKTGIVKDADGLFEYFFIDCQMSSCLQTSRIKQAIATVQLYVQRCLLGLEAEVASQDSDRISRTRWDWMKRYTLWEANRQVYLYPENWILPSLRDDKTPIFLDLESALQQKDVTLTNAVESLKSYIYSVSEVANLRVYGLFVDKDTDSDDSKFGVHIVARRVNAPFDWYSRDYSSNGQWSPWVKIPVDIPTFDVEDEAGHNLGSGALVSPFNWQGQPILFFLQMLRKNIPNNPDQSKTMGQHFNDDSPNQNPPIPIWEIRLGYTLFQNGKWGHKQLSSSSLRHRATVVPIPDPKVATQDPHHPVTIDTYVLPDQTAYQMVPRSVTGAQASDIQINVDIWYGKENLLIGNFVFTNGGVAQAAQFTGGTGINTGTFFQFIPNQTKQEMHSLQADNATDQPPYYNKAPLVQYDQAPVAGSKSLISVTGSTSYTFNHTFIDSLLKYITTTNKIDDLYSQFSSMSEAATKVSGDDPFGVVHAATDDTYDERMSPNSIYNWELGLHAPMTLIDNLLKAQRFDDALTVCHEIFDPSSIGTAGDDNSKYWKFFPFKALANTDAKKTLENLFLGLAPQTEVPAITDWRDNPYSPHAVARDRPVAYMKWIAMKYIEIMIAYGDYYFRQNSLETIPNAIQCYVIASHVYGPRGQKIPMRGKKKPQTYSSLLSKWDAFGNAVVQLEVEFPFSNQTSMPVGSSNGVTGFANIFGFATSLYFCIPTNTNLQAVRDTIDDRLFKIRNCMDINGVVRSLALWDPPIDPALLVQAVAQGLSLDTVLNDISGPIPNYRFQLLLQKAGELCTELKMLGNALLSVKEKGDSETLSNLRASHDTIIHGLMLDIKNRALDEANSALDQLQRSRESPAYRLQFYKFLVGLTDKAPAQTDEFNEIPNASMQAPTADSDLFLIDAEKEEIDKSKAAMDWNLIVGGTETLAAVFHALPTVEAAAKPMGAGAGLYWGGVNMGDATSAIARGLQTYTGWLSASSSNAGRRANLLRALQDRIFQANNSGMELKNIDRQIAVQLIRVSTAEQEIKNQQTQLDQATTVEEFLRNKYTNDELYSWMEGMTKTLYKQAYDLAFDLAKRAEKSYNFERPQNTAQFINMGYWNNAHDGLLAGEQLYLGLKQLESAYQENLGHDFEVTKLISIRQWAPLALIEFRDSGVFEVQLPEMLFDMDYPGHYMRRITSVAVTIPCVVGPYSTVNCTLRLLQHTIRTLARAGSQGDYPQQSSDSGGDADDPRFSTTNVPISAIVLSSGQNDTGRHETSLTDRYNPFEGAGVISRWRFEMPTDFRQFDYGAITDVIMHMRYTSCDGGDKLKTYAAQTVANYVKSMADAGLDQGLFTFFDLKADFASEWYAAFGAQNTAATREMNLKNLADRLPLFTKGTKPEKIMTLSMALLAQGSLDPGDVTISLQPNDTQQAVFLPGGVDIQLKDLVAVTSKAQMPMTNWKLRVSGGSVGVEGLWLVVRYAF